MPKQSKSRKKVSRAMKEVHNNPPAVVKSTKRKKGAKAAERQARAIGLAKARKAGARIPKKRG